MYFLEFSKPPTCYGSERGLPDQVSPLLGCDRSPQRVLWCSGQPWRELMGPSPLSLFQALPSSPVFGCSVEDWCHKGQDLLQISPQQGHVLSSQPLPPSSPVCSGLGKQLLQGFLWWGFPRPKRLNSRDTVVCRQFPKTKIAGERQIRGIWAIPTDLQNMRPSFTHQCDV